jgi:hypothetical protein
LGVRAVCSSRLILVLSEAVSAQRSVVLVFGAKLGKDLLALFGGGRRLWWNAEFGFFRCGAVVFL